METDTARQHMGPRGSFTFTAASAVLLALLGGPPAAAAVDYATKKCMQDVFSASVNCTANDVRIADALNVTVLDDGCQFPGDTVKFTANFKVETTATERYDIGLWFATDGDDNGDGAISGQCIIANLPTTPAPFVSLDSPADSCGDIKRANGALYPQIELTVECRAAPGTNKLLVPNCTSWQQTKTNAACNLPADAIPGSPSKCKCDDAFTIDEITVPPGELKVVKTVRVTGDPAGQAVDSIEIDEPGEFVTYRVVVQNEGVDPNNDVLLETLKDKVPVYGNSTPLELDITQTGNGILRTDCTLPPDGFRLLGKSANAYTCEFDMYVQGDAAGTIGLRSITDTVVAQGKDEQENAVEGEDTATVLFQDVLPIINVTKTVDTGYGVPDSSGNRTELQEPGGTATFTVTVNNLSVEPVTIVSLMDAPYGSLLDLDVCPNDIALAPADTSSTLDTYTCTFQIPLAGNKGDAFQDVATAIAADNEGNEASANATQTVRIVDVASDFTFEKLVSEDGGTTLEESLSVVEPGADITFVYRVKNTSLVDRIFVMSLTDDKLDLSSCPQFPGAGLAPGETYECSFTVFVRGEPATPHMNTATVIAEDDDKVEKTMTDSAVVSFINVSPAVSVTKMPTTALVNFHVVVANTSATTDAVTLTSLKDNVCGDIGSTGDRYDGANELVCQIIGTTCVLPAEPIASGNSFECDFQAYVRWEHENTVTATLVDNESTQVQPSGSAHVTFGPGLLPEQP